MFDFKRLLKWPVVSWLVIAAILLLLSFYPGTLGWLTFPLLAPLLVGSGAWVGYKAIQLGGGMGHALAGGLGIGMFAGLLYLAGYGIGLGAGIGPVVPGALTAVGLHAAGAMLGAGFALTK